MTVFILLRKTEWSNYDDISIVNVFSDQQKAQAECDKLNAEVEEKNKKLSIVQSYESQLDDMMMDKKIESNPDFWYETEQEQLTNLIFDYFPNIELPKEEVQQILISNNIYCDTDKYIYEVESHQVIN